MHTPVASPAPFIATATLPSGACKRFREPQCFDGYAAVWRAAGFLLAWDGPRTVVITRGAPDAAQQLLIDSPAPVGPPLTPLESPHGQA